MIRCKTSSSLSALRLGILGVCLLACIPSPVHAADPAPTAKIETPAPPAPPAQEADSQEEAKEADKNKTAEQPNKPKTDAAASDPKKGDVAGNLPIDGQKFGQAFLPLAKKFGFDSYAYAGRNDSGLVVYKYIPEGETLEKTTRVATLSLLPVGKTMEEGNKVISEYAALFRKGASAVVDQSDIKAPFGTIFYSHYEIAADTQRENNLSAIWQLMPGVIANFQVHRRDGAQPSTQIEAFKGFMDEMVKAPVPDVAKKTETPTDKTDGKKQ